MTTTFTCPECDHEHELVVVRGETKFEDYAELPERCEACGTPFDSFDSGVDDQQAERRQMGITN